MTTNQTEPYYEARNEKGLLIRTFNNLDLAHRYQEQVREEIGEIKIYKAYVLRELVA